MASISVEKTVATLFSCLLALCVGCQRTPTSPVPLPGISGDPLPVPGPRPAELVTVTGTVLSAGQPVADADVTGFQEGRSYGGPFFQAKTGPDGRFHIADVPAGVFYFHPGKPPYQSPCMTRSVVSQGTDVTLELVMTAQRPGHVEPLTLSGVVSDPDGKPVEDAMIDFSWGEDDYADLWTSTNKEGRYLFCGLFPNFFSQGSMWISASGFEEYSSVAQRVEPAPVGNGEFRLDVTLRKKR